MNISQSYPYKWICLLFTVFVLSACGNDIKKDLIALDQAMYESGMTASNSQKLIQQAEQAQSIETQMQVAKEIHHQFQVYNQAIAQLDFKSNEVRTLRNELSDHNRQMISALDQILQLNLRTGIALSPDQHQRATQTIERSQRQIQQADDNIQITHQKIQALGKDNGVNWR
ncbi:MULTISPECIES: hypothetical protein [Vitreoscilla]|uniref:Lipoprotein n=1 Tax=Vitreoscilla stercoraria TaxID=61 RepID=A0ABY4EDC3_VITST|nr:MULTISPECIES: hypothetical protein [Vitreoscilla]UOO91422.1 hypothetical protein LVJ81_07025 [Vitreoscilla stercoraria]